MKQPKTFLLLSIIVSVLILGIAYAAITNIEFELTGNATAAPSQENFKVVFGKVGTTDAPTFGVGTGTSAGVKVTFEIKSDRVATMDVTGLKKVGDTVTATFKIINESTDLDAVLSDVIATGTNNYFTVTAKAIDKTILAKQKTNLEVTITLKKLPVTSNAVASIAVNFEAAPENPQSQGGNGGSAGEEDPVIETITFSVDWVEYTADKGMTWAEWIADPKYASSTSGFYINEKYGYVGTFDYGYVWLESEMDTLGTSPIVAGGEYTSI